MNVNIYKVPLKKCIVCGNEFRRKNSVCCSPECSEEYRKNRKQYLSKESLIKLQNAGKKSAALQSNIRRSKNEIEFYNLCKQYFNKVEHNMPIFNGWDADIIIHDIKYAILWNGAWHYKQISKKQTLLQIQNRDTIKVNEIINYGYTPYIIKDMGKYNIDFVQERFNEFVNVINSKIKV